MAREGDSILDKFFTYSDDHEMNLIKPKDQFFHLKTLDMSVDQITPQTYLGVAKG